VDARVAWITIAPVKGLALSPRDVVEVGPAGVRGNRAFYLVDATGALVNGKRLGPLVGATAAWNERAATLRLELPGGEVVEGVVDEGESLTTSFYGRSVRGRVVGGAFAAALSEHVGVPLRLVRPVDEGAGVDRGDDRAVTILGTGSLRRLAAELGVAVVDPRRFRMLFGVDGIDPHDEDGWIGRRVELGGAVIEPLGNVGRCVVTTQDPDTGTRDLPTLEALSRYRGVVETTEPLPFGVAGRVVVPGRVRVGDPVVVS
jgi:uncharacterized protein YcbX